ncbi:MAG: hypothetical protein KIS79_12770 [Burkholderiales bacterium]|nr:hypothetical protein [Burkholderiales bacterium]
MLPDDALLIPAERAKALERAAIAASWLVAAWRDWDRPTSSKQRQIDRATVQDAADRLQSALEPLGCLANVRRTDGTLGLPAGLRREDVETAGNGSACWLDLRHAGSWRHSAAHAGAE